MAGGRQYAAWLERRERPQRPLLATSKLPRNRALCRHGSEARMSEARSGVCYAVLLADRAYDSDGLRLEMAARCAWANIKPMPGRKRRPPFSAFLYRYLNLLERFYSKLKHFRAVATRFEKHSENYLALVKLASAKIWMRFASR